MNVLPSHERSLRRDHGNKLGTFHLERLSNLLVPPTGYNQPQRFSSKPFIDPTKNEKHPTFNMADVEMTDAGAAPKVKNAKAGASGDAAEGKKKFEVKKVGKHGYCVLQKAS